MVKNKMYSVAEGQVQEEISFFSKGVEIKDL